MRYLSFIDVLRRYDIFITNYNGGFLRDTKLRFFEHIFWKIGKKKVVVWPYGSDSTIYSDMIDHSFRYGYFKSYPEIAKRENSIKKQICYFTKHADFLIGNIPHHESCPKWDMLTIACYGLDTEEWKPDSNYTYAKDGQNEAVVIIHSPNHRYVKGTEFLIETCEQIKKDGYKIDLKIIEGMKHNRLKKLMKHCDILAAQFLYGYALTEIEGMSLAKPVLSNLENDHYYTAARRYTYFKECPIVSTTPENIKENLIRLIQNPGLRKTIGKKGREFVIKYHSLEGQGLMWSKIIANVWNNKDEDLCDWWKDR